LFGLTVVVLKETCQPAKVALCVPATFFAMEVLSPARTDGAPKLLIAPRVGARGLEDLLLNIIAMLC
jgi:hypothetical protein